jgi:hypothetical protein
MGLKGEMLMLTRPDVTRQYEMNRMHGPGCLRGYRSAMYVALPSFEICDTHGNSLKMTR